VNKEIRL